MKKTSKILAVVLATLLVVAAVVVLAGCEDDPVVTNGVAYGIVHSNKYIGKATVTVTDGKLTAATLDEVVTPNESYSAAPESMRAANADFLTSSNYWKTVKWGSVSAKWDDDANGYKIGNQTWAEFFANEANCRDYFEAAAANKITVVTVDGDKTDVLTSENLLKTKNGYWTGDNYPLGWKGNVEKTIAYVIANGFDATLAKDGTWKDSNGVDTGATWNDMEKYVAILKLANDRALAEGEVVVTGEVTHIARNQNYEYYVKVDVTVKDGKIVAVRLYTEEETGKQMVTTSWGSHDRINAQFNAWIEANIVGKTVATVLGWNVDLEDGTEVNFDKATLGVGVVADGTATSGRIIAAIQDALSKLEA